MGTNHGAVDHLKGGGNQRALIERHQDVLPHPCKRSSARVVYPQREDVRYRDRDR